MTPMATPRKPFDHKGLKVRAFCLRLAAALLLLSADLSGFIVSASLR
jgi:hypothetical protein